MAPRLSLDLAAGALFLLAAGCQPRSNEVAPPSVNVAVDAAVEAAAVTAVDAAVEENPTVAAPLAPKAADTELVAIASAMCAATVREDDGRVYVGCRKPPPFKGPGRAPDGKIPVHGGNDVMTFCGITVRARGSFSAPGKKQALVAIDNCRDETSGAGWNGSLPGSAAVVEAVDGRWQNVGIVNAVSVDDCRALARADGRDVLMCRRRSDAASIGTMYFFFTLDFAGGKGTARTVAHLFDDVENWNCMAHEGQPKLAPHGITRLGIVNVTTKDTNGDGTPDLAIEVERAHAAPSSALETRLSALCKQSGSIVAAVPAATKVRLEIVSDGDRFRPTDATKALLAKWRSESPDVIQLEGTAPPKAAD